jgi:uncharacterized protein YbbC (DUF1343 family)
MHQNCIFVKIWIAAFFMNKTAIFFVLLFFGIAGFVRAADELIVGGEQPGEYLPLLKDKKVGLVANHSALVFGQHLLDFLVSKDVRVEAVFAPEHGFRGEAAAGDSIADGKDARTGVQIISIYGANKKPTPEQLKGIDILVFDIQDVGCRFYTYISTLHYIVEACAENNISLLILDRPNPNGDYVAGPILEPEFRSFVGMDPIPVVHGCTIGEMALMIDGEGWHSAGRHCLIKVVKVKGYKHTLKYSLPVPPSPNLPNDLSVRLYPSLCFFEATSVSIGRGTSFPFQVIGYPDKRFGDFRFTPRDISGVSIDPPQEGVECFGLDLRREESMPQFTLKYFLDFYKKFEKEADFLTRENWLDLLAGTHSLVLQIRAGKTEEEILESWNQGLEKYMAVRAKYLLYPDFEKR